MVERRPDERFMKRLAVRIESNGRQTTRFTRNVSAGGLFVLGAPPARPGEIVQLEVGLPEFGTVHLKARLVWGRRVPRGLESVTRAGFGLKIVESAPVWGAWCRHLAGRRREGPVSPGPAAPAP